MHACSARREGETKCAPHAHLIGHDGLDKPPGNAERAPQFRPVRDVNAVTSIGVLLLGALGLRL
jgi:hypothetical protein